MNYTRAVIHYENNDTENHIEKKTQTNAENWENKKYG